MTKVKKAKTRVTTPSVILLSLFSFFLFSFFFSPAIPSFAQGTLCNIHHSNPRGPQIECSYCHNDPPTASLKDGLGLAGTPICNDCHSPEGQFDGVNDLDIGAKANWEDGVYDGDSLKQGKEKWCVGCHDDGGDSVIQNIAAPNIAGLSISSDWQSATGITSPATPEAINLIDGNTDSGMVSNEIIIDLTGGTSDPAVISHIRLYTEASASGSHLEVYGGNDLSSWTRIAWGQSVLFSAPTWLTSTQEGWNEIRLDKFIPVRYIKLVKANPWPLSQQYFREFEFKQDLQYGYYVTGHKISCEHCHDLASAHIDGVAQTYKASLDNYQTGYRLKDANSPEGPVPPLEIPRTGCNNGENPRTSHDFALCFECHDKYKLLGDAYGSGDFLQDPPATNFRNDDHVDANGKVSNEHLRHLRGRYYCGSGQDWDSDWDGVADSPISCPACHNVHGSPSPLMTRHGELTSSDPDTMDKSPMFNFKYLNTDGKPDSNISKVLESTGGQTQFLATGPGSPLNNNTCNMCHGTKIAYTRTPVASPITNCQGCHHDMAAHPSHGTHLAADPRGPNLACTDCHSDGSVGNPHLRQFKDGKSLAETTVCDDCHSKDGPFNGVSDPVIGAKTNWQNGVYQTSDRLRLKTNLENWCAGCHDNGTSVCSGVSAPNVMGDNSTYGYNITGHKIACSACHDLTVTHIDGKARTYSHNSDPWNSNDPTNYQNGYRLRDPMIIPLGTGPNGGNGESRFELCFECHNYDQIMGTSAPYETNFQDDGVNRHLYHLSATTSVWDSDWDNNTDSRMSCPACHNVHGSPSPVMIRHGELISTPGTQDKVPALNFRWYEADGYTTTTTMLDGESGYGDMPPLGGVGAGTLEDSKVCNGCHYGPGLIKYDRDGSYQAITMPTGSWAKPPLPPSVRCLDPEPGSTEIAIDHTVSFILCSNGINNLTLSTLSISLQGNLSYSQTYGYGDSEVNVSPIPNTNCHEVVVSPLVNFGNQEKITVTISIQDEAGHSLTSPDWSFETGLSSPVLWRSPQAVYNESGFWYPELLIDDHNETGNPEIPFGVHWAVYDLGQSYQVTKVRLLIPAPEGRLWTISVSDDPNNFGTAVKANWLAQLDSITVDNTDASFTGTWPNSTSVAGYYGADYQSQTTVVGSPNATCTWTPQIPAGAAGLYKVYARWTSETNRASEANYTINYDGGSDTVTVNQQANGGKWILLGTYFFSEGTSGNIVLSNDSSATGFYVVADAIRLIKADAIPGWISTSFTQKEGRYLKIYTAGSPVAPDSIREIDFAE